jgi:uncharacterized membrane protein YgcG
MEARLRAGEAFSVDEINAARAGILPTRRVVPGDPVTWSLLIVASWDVDRVIGWLSSQEQMAFKAPAGRGDVNQSNEMELRARIVAMLTAAGPLNEQQKSRFCAQESDVMRQVTRALEQWRLYRAVVDPAARERVFAQMAGAAREDNMDRAIKKVLGEKRGGGGGGGAGGGGAGGGGNKKGNNNNGKGGGSSGNGARQQA